MFVNCIPFYNELDLLELRFNTMSYVDKFIICEMNMTHSTREKPLYFEEAKDQERFKKFEDKIIHLKVNSPCHPNAWVNENYQRDIMKFKLDSICRPKDIVIVQDADEILSEDFMEKIEGQNLETPLGPQLHFYRYYLNAEIVGNKQWWMTGPVLMYMWLVGNSHVSLTGLRNMHPELRVKDRQILDCGWHFTFLGGAAAISEKMKVYAHQESNLPHLTDSKRIQEALDKNQDACNPSGPGFFKKELTESDFPKYVFENQEKFKKYLL